LGQVLSPALDLGLGPRRSRYFPRRLCRERHSVDAAGQSHLPFPRRPRLRALFFADSGERCASDRWDFTDGDLTARRIEEGLDVLKIVVAGGAFR